MEGISIIVFSIIIVLMMARSIFMPDRRVHP